jgi:hypothetical protein
MRFSLALLVLLALARPSVADPPELIVIVSPDNSVKISAEYLESLFLKKDKFWQDSTPVIALNAPPDNPARREFDRVVLGMSADSAARYWIDLRIRSGAAPPKEVADPALAVRLVAKLKGAIAYVPVATAITGVRIVGRIKSGKWIAAGS